MMNRTSTQIIPATKQFPMYTVVVQEFKFDSIRQESYWTTRHVKCYRLRSDAEMFASRW
jgi:hypothetical protein